MMRLLKFLGIAVLVAWVASASALAAVIGFSGPLVNIPTTTRTSTFYVAPSGSDLTGDGSPATPWQTVQYAQTIIEHSGVLSNMSADVTLYMMPGDYWLGEGPGPIVLGPADSGSNGFSFVLRSSGGINTVRLLGGKRVSGCVVYSGSIYRCIVTGSFYTMYENGARGILARYPALVPDSSYPMARTPYLLSTGVDTSTTVLQYGVGDLTAPNLWDLTSARIFVWSGGGSPPGGGGRAWTADDVPIASVNVGSRQLTLAGQTNFAIYAVGVGSRYFAQGDLSFLVGPGQWYHDAAGGFLYYWPRSSPLASQEIVAPTMTRAISIAGSSASVRAHHIAVKEIEVSYGDYAAIWQPNDGPNVLNFQRNGLVHVSNADHVLLDRVNVNNSGMHGVLFTNYAQNDTIQNTKISHTGAVGLYVLNPSVTVDQVLNNLGDSLDIGHCGELVGDGHCFYSIDSGLGTWRYMNLHDSPRSCLATEGQYPMAAYQRGNLFDHIKMTGCTQDSGDQGPLDVNSTGDATHQNGDTYSQITIDRSAPNSSVTDIPNPCIFADTNSCSQTYVNFQVTNCQAAQYKTGDNTGSVFTNTSFQSDGTANPGFNASLMDYANIGVRAGFPY